MRWYTNVKKLGNKIYAKGYEDRSHFFNIIDYKPTIYFPAKSKTEYRSIEGRYLEPIQLGSIKEINEFRQKYSSVEGVSLFGNSNAVYQYISENYPEENIEYDISKINIVSLDIETTAENGPPDPESCLEEILLITIQNYNTKETITWGSKPFTKKLENHTYHYCKNETGIFYSFLNYWQKNYPDIITGWNILAFDFPYIVKRMMSALGQVETRKLSPFNWISSRKIEAKNGTQITVFDIYGVSTVDYYDLYKKYSFKNPENHRLDTIAYNELRLNKLSHDQYDSFKDFYEKDWDLFTEYNIIDTQLINKLEDKLHMIELAIMLAFYSKTNFEDVFFQVRMWDSIIFNYLKRKNIIIPFEKEEKEKLDKFIGAYVKEPKTGVYDYVVSTDLTSLYPHIMMQHYISPDTLVDRKEIEDRIVYLENVLNAEPPFVNFSGKIKWGDPNKMSIDEIEEELNLARRLEVLSNSISVNSVLSKDVDTNCLNRLNVTITPNGSVYTKTKVGFLAEILTGLFDMRKSYKDKMKEYKKQYEETQDENLKRLISTYSIKEQSVKVCLNSCYGATGNPHFRFFDIRNAEAVTYTGQLAIKWIEKKFNHYFNKILKTNNVDYIIYMDTDSCFLNMMPVVDEVFKNKKPTKEEVVNFLDKLFSTTIQRYLDESYSELAEILSAPQNKLHMKREKICDRMVFLARKKYLANVWDNEGIRYHKPEISATGVEAIRSSTPAYCRAKLKEAIDLIMNSDPESMIQFVEKTKQEFLGLTPEEIAFPKSVNNVKKYKSPVGLYVKGTPIQVRAAILYNHYLKKKKLTKKYNEIQSGDKIKFCYLKLPNPIHEDVIAFSQELPKEFGLQEYIDYNQQYEKTFLSPLKSILDVVGWDTEKRNTLDAFFV